MERQFIFKKFDSAQLPDVLRLLRLARIPDGRQLSLLCARRTAKSSPRYLGSREIPAASCSAACSMHGIVSAQMSTVLGAESGIGPQVR
jgi:hypothetical protein